MKRFVLALSVILASYRPLVPNVQAAELDPHAPVTVQLSPVECASAWIRTQAWPLTTDDAGEALAKFAKACDFEGIAAKASKADAEKRKIADSDFPGPRIPRVVPRDSLDLIVEALSPSKERPISPTQYAAFKKVRVEFGEILAGRNPYAHAK